MQATVRRCAFTDIEADPQFVGLAAEYAQEAAVPGLHGSPDLAKYRALEAAGALHCARADVDGGMVGFVLLLCPEMPHYSQRAAVTESLFVRAADRGSGAGLALLAEAEQIAADLGASMLFVSCPAASRLAWIMERKGWDQTNVVYGKKVSA